MKTFPFKSFSNANSLARSSLMLAAALLTLLTQPMQAADFYWDADLNAAGNATTGAGLGSITQGTRGTTNFNNIWDTTRLTWWDGVNSPDIAVSAATFATPGNVAIFNGTGGTVNLSPSINNSTVDTIRVDSSGYIFQMDNSNNLASGNGSGYNLRTNALTGTGTATFQTNAGASLTLNSAGNQTVSVNIGIAAENQVSLIKTGAGTLTWNGVLNSVRHASATDTTVQVLGGTLILGTGWSGGSVDSGISLANAGSSLDFNGRSMNFGRGISGTSNTTVTNSNATLSTVTFGGNRAYGATTDALITGNLALVYGPSSGLGNVLTLNNSGNTYSGGTFVNNGTLAVSSDAALGTGGLSIGSGANNRFTMGFRSTLSTNSPLTITKNLGFAGGDRMSVVFGSTTTGDLTFSSSTASLGGTMTEFDIQNANTTFQGNLTGARILKKFGPGNLILSGSSSFSGGLYIARGLGGTTFITAGTVIANSIGNAGDNSSIGAGSNTISATAFAITTIANGGTLRYAPISSVGGAATSTDRLFAIGPLGGTIDASGTGAINFTNTGAQNPERAAALTSNTTAINTNGLRIAGLTQHRLLIGMTVTGTNIPAGTTITGIDTNTTTVLLSNNVTGAIATGASINFGYGTRTMTLTGTNTGNNTIAGILADPTTGGGNLALTKSGVGTWVLSGANTYTGATIIENGTLNVTGTLANTTAVTVNTSGTYNVGATDTVGAVTLAGGTISNSGGAVLTGSSYAVQSGTVSGILGGTGALTKSTAGTVTLSGANTYTGQTTVGAGTLLLASTGSISGSTLIQIQSGATLDASAVTGGFQLASGQKLQNTGTFLGNLTAQSGSTYAPGNSPGISTQSANLTLNTGSTFEFELVANTTSGAGTNFDQTQFTVANTTDLTIQSGVNASLVFNFTGSTVNWANTFWDANQSWLVFTGADTSTFGGGSGIFSGTQTVGLDSAGNSLTAARGSFAFTNTGPEVFLNYTAIPEPSTYAMLGLGLAALVWLRRKNKNNKA